MKPTELGEEITIELDALETTVSELIALQHDVAHREPTIRESTAAAAFLAQFYNGIENILKRTSHYHNVPLPTGETWHVDLFQRFCTPSHPDLPSLFDETFRLRNRLRLSTQTTSLDSCRAVHPNALFLQTFGGCWQ